MTDIYLAIGIVLCVAVLAAAAAYRAARRGGRWLGVPLAVLAVAAIGLHVAYFRHSIWPARILPVSSMMILADPSPVLAGIVIGAGAVILPGGALRRAGWLVALAAICLFASYGQLLGTPPQLRNVWRNGVCRQTSLASCGPAAAATLLAANGIPATEAEMARLCLTTADGTSTRGIYRGLFLKTAGTNLRVEPFRGDVDALCRLDGPVLLNVRLDLRPDTDPRYVERWGWRPGVPHTVVLFRYLGNDHFEVGDPAVRTGRELWHRKDMDTLWHGEGLRLVPR